MLKRTTKPLKRRVLVEEGQAKSSKKQHSETQTSGIFVKQVVFHTVNHRGPLPLKELHSTGETIVWRDPGGSWACLPPVHKCNHSATICDTRGIHPKQHTKKRGALGNTKKTKTTRRRAGMWVEEVYENDPKGSIQNERSPMKCYMEQNHSVTIIAWLMKAKEKALKWTSQTGKKPYKNHSEKNSTPQNAEKNNKTTKKKSSGRRREGQAKSSKKQHSENTDKWHLRKAVGFSSGESPRTPPLEGTSLHRWNNSVERPWGILSLFTTCLQVQSLCHRLRHTWNTPQTAH